MKKKLLVFHPALAPYKIDFFNFLNDNFDAKFFFVSKFVRGQNFDQRILRSECTFVPQYLNCGFEFGNRSFRFGIFRLIGKENPDTVFCCEYGQISLGVLFYKKFFRPGLKVYTLSEDNIALASERKGLRKWAMHFSCKELNGIFLTSTIIAKWYKRHVNPNLTSLELPNAHLNEKFRKLLREAIPISNKKILENRLGSKKVLLYVGRLAPEKNIRFLLTAFSKTHNENFILVIVGEGNLEKELKDLSRQLNIFKRVIFTGRFDGLELLSWYNIAEYFILPSYYEPFGAVVNEALLAGCKVICSEVAGAATLINSDNGILFDPYDQNELIKILKQTEADMNFVNSDLKLKEDRMPYNLKDKFNEILNNI